MINYALTEDILEKTPRSFRCQVYAGMLDYLFERILKSDDEVIRVLNFWSN